MVHIYSKRNIIDTLIYATLTFFIIPYLLVEKFKIIQLTHFNDPCQVSFIIGFIISLLLWNFITKKNVY